MKISRKDIRKILKEITAEQPCDVADSPPDRDLFMDIKNFVKNHGGCGISDKTVEQIIFGYTLNRLLPLHSSRVSDEMGRVQSDLNSAIQNGVQAALSVKNT